ncbi:MAG: diadenosine tetraphosphate hydrolase [Nocardioides sp.]
MDFRSDRVGTALAGTNPTVLRRLSAGFAVIGDVQHLPGYSVLISDTPGVDQLTDLDTDQQQAFLGDAALLARAVSTVCRRDPQFRRINVEVQGNTDAFLHAHVTPRYEWEPAEVVGWPAALHHWTGRVTDEHRLGPQHDDLREQLGAAIDAELGARDNR